MKKLAILSLIAPAVLGLAACGGSKDAGNATVSNDTVVNADDVALPVDANATTLNDTVPVENTVNAN